MRLLATSLAVLAMAAPAMAQSQGSFALDVMTTRDQHFGVGYYVTDAISLRPRLGAGYSSEYGFNYAVGLDLRWEVLAARRFSPYATAGVTYQYDEAFTQYDSAGVAIPTADSSWLRSGAGLGVRTRLNPRLAVVAEGHVVNSAAYSSPSLSGNGMPTRRIEDGTYFEAAVGISFTFN